MTGAQPLDVLIVEDEVLLACELGYIVEDSGCHDVGHAMDTDEAMELASREHPDLSLIDVHLGDGPTGVDVARRIIDECGGACLFMTANVRRLPADYAGACGVIGKPYSETTVKRALQFLTSCLRDGRAPGPAPLGFTVAPAFARRWGLTDPVAASLH
jgi:CheY-like chemotaxis protein